MGNVNRNIAKQTNKKLLALNWPVINHSSYTMGLTLSNYHLFGSLAHALEDNRFENEKQLREFLDTFFKSQPAAFYERGIKSLPMRWQHVIDKEGGYVDE